MKLATEYPPATRGRVIVWGMLASFPFGGMTWQALHYVVGLRRLGFDVWYVEDTKSQPLDPVTFCASEEYTVNVRYLARSMELVGLSDRWVFRPAPDHDTCYGACDQAGLKRLYREADAVLNVCGYHDIRPEHEAIHRLLYVQTDPMAEQVKVALGDPDVLRRLDRHDLFFTYAENLGAEDCLMPVDRYRWQPTRPPVCLDWWAGTELPRPGNALTTVSNWEHWENEVIWQGTTYYWRKDREFKRFADLPRHSALPLELALENIEPEEAADLREHGWRIVRARDLADPAAYRDYIRTSLGEFTVAKDQYVRPRTGWFSDRSVCYLAAGRPVITQETGFSSFMPTGKGLFAFETVEDVVAAVASIKRDYEEHCRAARVIAAEYFAAEKVLDDLMQRADL